MTEAFLFQRQRFAFRRKHAKHAIIKHAIIKHDTNLYNG